MMNISKSLGFSCSVACLLLPWSPTLTLELIWAFTLVLGLGAWLMFPMSPYSEMLYTFLELGGELTPICLLERYSLVDLLRTSLLFGLLLDEPIVDVQKSNSLKMDAFFESGLFWGVPGYCKELRNVDMLCFGGGWTGVGGCRN